MDDPSVSVFWNYVIEATHLNRDDVQTGLTDATARAVPAWHVLRTLDYQEAQALAERLAHAFHVPILTAVDSHAQNLAKPSLPVSLFEKHGILPLAVTDDRLSIAVIDPSDKEAFDAIRFATGLSVHVSVMSVHTLHEHLQLWLQQVDVTHEASTLDAHAQHTQSLLARLDADTSTDFDKEPVVHFVNQVLADAISKRASDIHFEPYETAYRVRYRIDGLLHEMARPPLSLGQQLTARLKVMAHLDITQRRLPQDGRFAVTREGNSAMDCRISTLPTLWGEKVVLRLLDAQQANLSIDGLGFTQMQQEQYLQALSSSQGLILVTGPTGSGKSLTLYSGLQQLNTPQRNISTAEDPIEIYLEGINQVPVDAKHGLSFADALRAFLRQDPDVIMVGEIRDIETANMAIKASQTGHLVLATLHTNSAAETLTRLLNMGIARFNLSSALNVVIAQRLVRCLCPLCKQKELLTDDMLRDQGFSESMIAAGVTSFKAIGCSQCQDGFHGRTAIYEVVPMIPALAQLVLAQGYANDFADVAAEAGFINVRQSGLRKVAAGMTSLQEVNRVMHG